MCGFVGVFNYMGGQPPDREALRRGASLLRHRGPDDSGEYFDDSIGMVHRRLSVIDLSRSGRQPMANEDGRLQLVYNGEVYNFRDLRRRFRLQDNHQFRSRTDTEVVLHLYEEKGLECLPELNGMFAFAVWDGRRQELHLVRDPFGIKPLFYHDSGHSLWFGSEIKALLAAGAVSPRPDPRALSRYLQFDYIPGELTAFEGIRELRPGNWLRARRGSGGTEIGSYWSWPGLLPSPPSRREAVERCRQLLRESVERQLVSDVPVGVMLSGGMDSSALTVMMKEIRGDADFHTFSLAFEDRSFDETCFARLAAEHAGTRHHIIPVTAEKIWDNLARQAAYIDEPYADGAAIPTLLLSAYAEEFVTVLLSGEAGDEVFAGYDTHLAYKYREAFLRLPGSLRRLAEGLSSRLPVSHRKLSLEFRLKRFLAAAESSPAASHFLWRSVARGEAVEELTGSRIDPADEGGGLFESVYDSPPPHDPIGRLTRIDCSYHLPDDLMIKCDRMTMAFSLEARVPFADCRLVQYAMALPDEIRLPGRRQKYLLRRAMRGQLPRAILRKKKVGMEIPYSRWFCEEWKDKAAAVFSGDTAACGGLLNPGAVRRIWREHQRRAADHGRLLWGLLNYIVWYDNYIAHPGRFADFLNRVRRSRRANGPGLDG